MGKEHCRRREKLCERHGNEHDLGHWRNQSNSQENSYMSCSTQPGTHTDLIKSPLNPGSRTAQQCAGPRVPLSMVLKSVDGDRSPAPLLDHPEYWMTGTLGGLRTEDGLCKCPLLPHWWQMRSQLGRTR